MEAWQIISRIGTGIYRRRKLMAVLIFTLSFLVLGTIGYFGYGNAPRHRTSATIVLEGRADQIPLFQEWAPKRPIQIQLAILQSHSLAESVVASLPKAAIDDLVQNRYYHDYQLKLTNLFRMIVGAEPVVYSPQRIALDELRHARISFQPQNNGLVVISAEAASPRVAMDLVNTYIEVLLARTKSFNIEDAKTAREYLEQQVLEVKKSMKVTEDSLANFTKSRGGIKVPEQSQATVARLTAIEGQLAEVQAEKRMGQARLAALKQKIETQKSAPAAPAAPAEVVTRTPANIQRLQALLTQLEGQLLEMSGRYTDEHPRVALVKDRITDLQRQIAASIKETTPVTPVPGTVARADRASFANAVLALEASMVTLGAQEEALSQQAAILRKNLSGLTTDESEYSRLGRDAESSRRLYALLSENLSAARIREQGEMRMVKVIDPSGYPTPVSATTALRLFAISAMFSTVIGAGIPALLEYLSMPAEQEDDVARATNLPVLGMLPALKKTGPTPAVPGVVPLLWSRRALPERTNGSHRAQNDDLSFFIESFRRIRSAIQLATMGNQVKTIMVLSPYDQEGKSTVVFNVGMSFWEIGKRVILADADFYRPTLHKSLKVPARAGLVDLLSGKSTLQNSMVPVADGLWVSTRGSALPAQGRGLLTSGRLREVVDEMANEADLVFFDSSPLMIIPDSLFLASAVDAVILVAKAGKTRLKDLVKTKELLEKAGANVLGVVLNQVPPAALRQYYKRYYKTYIKEDAR